MRLVLPLLRLGIMHMPRLASVAPTHGEMVTARNPVVLPDFVRQYSCVLPQDDVVRRGPWSDIECPADLHSAPPKRQLHYRAGRYCAFRALEALQGRPVTTDLPRTTGGAPLWPTGVTGSITHTDDFVSAAVARTSHVGALGIDTERIMSADRAARVSLAVAWPCELAHARAVGFNRLEALTLVFSAKEAIFKTLYSSVGRIFDFHEVRITAIDAHSRTFTVRLITTLSNRLTAGTVLNGTFEIDLPWIHTALFLQGPLPSTSDTNCGT